MGAGVTGTRPSGTIRVMANNPLIYNGALNGATGGIHERWITSTQSTDYLAIRVRILDFADTIDQLIPTDPALSEADGNLMQTIVSGVLADRFINLTDDFLAIAQAIVTLWNVMRGSLEPVSTDVSSDNVIIDVTLLPPDGNQFPGGGIDVTLTQILIADGDYTGPGTGFPGWVSRYAWVNAASPRIGSTFAGTTVTAAPTVWATEADVPPGNIFWFRQWGSGAGGGSGSASRSVSGTSSLNGGGPGGGGAMNEFTLTRAQVLASLPITFSTPLRGIGGASVNGTGISVVNGNSGTSGDINTITGIGLFETAGGGQLGQAGTNGSTGAAGSGGGRLSNAISTSLGGYPLDTTPASNTTIYNIIGGARTNSRDTGGAAGTSQYAFYGGSGGGSNQSANTVIAGGRSKYGGCGGGHGGRYLMSSGLVIQTSDGGGHDINSGAPWGGGGGLGGTTAGANGANGADGNETRGGEGGGGGMACNGSTGTNLAGRGGDGGFPGGGGGGGGGAFGGSATGVSGRGGDGGDALTLLTILI